MNDSHPPSDGRPVIVTGAAGRVASRLLPLLMPKHEVWPTDIMDAETPNWTVRKIDLTDREQVISGFAGAGAIVHCAIARYPTNDPCQRSEAEVADYHERMLNVNIRGTYHVFEAARVHTIPRVVYISSLTVAMGDATEKGMRPSRPPKPVDLYACTKLFGENLAEVYHHKYGIDTIILRLGQPYPMGLHSEKQWESDWQSSSLFVTFPDVARAIDAALSARHVRFGKYNIVSKNETPRVDSSSGLEIGFEPIEHWQAASNRDEREEALSYAGHTSSASVCVL